MVIYVKSQYTEYRYSVADANVTLFRIIPLTVQYCLKIRSAVFAVRIFRCTRRSTTKSTLRYIGEIVSILYIIFT